MQKKIKNYCLYPFTLMAIILFAVSCQQTSQKKKQPVNEIDLKKENWLFKTGDDINYANPNYKPANWHAIKVNRSWSQQGYTEHKGKAWYRLSIKIPSSLKKNKYFQSKKYIKLHLGQIGDVDRTFFNGKFIGQTGNFKPLANERSTKRIYKIPAKYINWDHPNTIAIRVLAKGEKKRGLYKGTPKITCPALSDYSKTQITPYGQNGIFYGQNELSLNYKLNPGQGAPFSAGNVNYNVRLPPTKSSRIPFINLYHLPSPSILANTGTKNSVTPPKSQAFTIFIFMLLINKTLSTHAFSGLDMNQKKYQKKHIRKMILNCSGKKRKIT